MSGFQKAICRGKAADVTNAELETMGGAGRTLTGNFKSDENESITIRALCYIQEKLSGFRSLQRH